MCATGSPPLIQGHCLGDHGLYHLTMGCVSFPAPGKSPGIIQGNRKALWHILKYVLNMLRSLESPEDRNQDPKHRSSQSRSTSHRPEQVPQS